jgi:hypothetical protein
MDLSLRNDPTRAASASPLAGHPPADVVPADGSANDLAGLDRSRLLEPPGRAPRAPSSVGQHDPRAQPVDQRHCEDRAGAEVGQNTL